MEINKKFINKATITFLLFLVYIFCLSLVSCTDSQNISRLKELLTNTGLRDPSSVQLKDVFYDKFDDGEMWMGKINAKNLYGAYTGYKGFFYIFYKDRGRGELAIYVPSENYNMKDDKSIDEWEIAKKPYDKYLTLSMVKMKNPKVHTIAELEKIRDAKWKDEDGSYNYVKGLKGKE
jgi:hypothetical protein